MTTATTTSLGVIRLAGDLAGNNNGLAPELTPTGVAAGVHTLPVITVNTKGQVTAATSATTAVITALIPDATNATKGIGSFPSAGGLVISAGAVSVPDATGLVKGIARFGVEFATTSGVVSLSGATLTPATNLVLGAVRSGANIINTAGTLSVNDATSLVKGVARFNATDFTVTGGAVSLNSISFPVATNSTLGTVITGTHITNTAGTISIANATSAVRGVASFGSDFTVTAGNVVINYAVAGPLLAAAVPDATPFVKGKASFGTGLSVSAGNVTINYAAIGAALAVATAANLGVVRTGGVGTNITNTAGTLSVPNASTTVRGAASFNSLLFSVSSGAVSLSSVVARTNEQNTWTMAQRYAIVPLTFSANITPDFSLSNVFSLTATGNFTLSNPINAVAGTTYIFIVTQDATGGRVVTWGSNFRFGSGAVSSLSIAANSRDIISIVALTSSLLLTTTQLGF